MGLSGLLLQQKNSLRAIRAVIAPANRAVMAVRCGRSHQIGVLVVLTALLLGSTAGDQAFAQTRPAAPPLDKRASPGNPGWAVDVRTGCWVWNSNPQPVESVTWTAGCEADGRASGSGHLVWDYGGKTSSYEGEILDGKQHGRGINTWADGSRYEGEYRNNTFHGRGVYVGASGYRYEGDYLDGKQHGRGINTWANGDRYEGEFRDAKFHGRGIYTLANGDRFEGEYRDGKAHGRGVYTGANGFRYEGEHLDGKRHGRGINTWANGNRYEGEYRNGRPDGIGSAVLNGSRYVGRWADGCYRDGDSRAAINRPLAECP